MKETLYGDGLKQLPDGTTYYLTLLRDDRGNVLYQGKTVVQKPEDLPPIVVNMRDPGSGQGHEWLITPRSRSPIFCGSVHCPICAAHKAEQQKRHERRERVRASLGLPTEETK